MEGSGTEETKMGDGRLTSAAAFVEGGIQDACDDACSICLEEFCDSDPSTVTTCKHEFHLQCILEWCQRSAQCPMCWQAISLKDPSSQELLEAVEHERSIRSNPTRNATIFHHPTLGNFELQHLPVGSNDAELEERIIQHLAAAAAMGRAHHFARREGQRSRSTSQGRPQFLVFSSHPNAPPAASLSSSPAQREGDSDPASEVVVNPSAGEPAQGIPQLLSSQTDQIFASTSRSSGQLQHGISFSNRSSASHTSQVNHDRAGPSELQSFSESLKSRLNSVSMRYKESITKSTRGWKDRLFSRSTSMADIGSEVKREVNAGIASVSRLMERLETRENIRPTGSSMSINSVTETDSQTGTHGNNHPNDTSASCAASSGQT